MNIQRLSLKVAEKLREIATRQGNVPFKKGDLRKAHVVEPFGTDAAIIAVNTPYARAVHDGRHKVKIKLRRKKGKFSKKGRRETITQPAREGNPWLVRAIEELEQEGIGFLADDIGQDVADDLTDALRARGVAVRRE
jgi:hypothetical protein